MVNMVEFDSGAFVKGSEVKSAQSNVIDHSGYAIGRIVNLGNGLICKDLLVSAGSVNVVREVAIGFVSTERLKIDKEGYSLS